MEWAKANLGQLTRGQLFSAQAIAQMQNYVQQNNQFIAGPDQKYVVSADDLKPFDIPHNVKIRTYNHRNVAELYKYTDFKHALSYSPDSLRPDMLAAAAEVNGEIAAIAGASLDYELMWQIGVDVLPQYQGMGLEKL